MIHISKSRITFNYIEIDDDVETPMSLDVLSTTLGIVSYLAFPVELEDDVTVQDIMGFLQFNMEATDYVFDSSLGGHPFREFAAEMNADIPDSVNIQRMEICHEVDEVHEDNFLTGATRLRGIGFDGKLFSVEFSPVSTYMRLPLSLNNTYNIRLQDGTSVSLKKDFTLYDLINAILFEMSFYGTPDMRQAALEDILRDDQGEIEIIEEGASGEGDDLKKLTRDLEREIESENYEAAARLRDRIRQMKGTNGDGFDITKK